MAMAFEPEHAALQGFKTIIEPFRIHSTQQIPFPTREERLEAIRKVGCGQKKRIQNETTL